MPLMPTPPNGAVRSRTRNVLTQTVPARTARPTRSARSCGAGVDDRRQAVAGGVGELDRLAPRRRTSGTSAPGRTPRAARSRSRCDRGSTSVGSYQRPPHVRRLPPRTISSPFARARSTKPSTRARWSGWISGRDGGRVVARVAQHVRVDDRRGTAPGSGRRTDSSTSSRVPARHTWPASSYWPAALRGGRVQVGVVEHDQRALAAQLAGERHDVARPRPGRSARRSRASR